MSDFYWLHPSWTKARCHCGVNIWDSGGDPDHGECFECFSKSIERKSLDQQYESYMNSLYEEYVQEELRQNARWYLEAGGVFPYGPCHLLD